MKLELQGSLWEVKAAQGEKKGIIAGVAVPWNEIALVNSGQAVKFLEGSLPVDGPNPKFILDHDMSKPLGMVTERVSTADGMMFSAQLAPTALASETLLQAGPNNFYDSVSVGVEPIDYSFEESVMVVKSARWMELSLLPFGAFEGAKVAVAASEPEPQETNPDNIPEEEPMSELTPVVEAAPVADAIPTLVYASAKRETVLPTAAEYIVAAVQGGAAMIEMQNRIRAAAPSAPYIDTQSNSGLLPEILVQPVYNNFVGKRATIDSIGVKAIPASGSHFRLPYVSTQPSVGVQSAENAALTSSTIGVSYFDVAKSTYGTYSTLSEQDLDWSSPEVVSILLDSMARVYAYETNNAVADALLAAVSQSAVLTDPTSPAEWVSDISDAAVTILNASNGNMPTTLWLSPNMYGYLNKLVDTAGRPLLAGMNPMNNFGDTNISMFTGTAFGLNVIVDRAFASDTVIVGDPSGYFVGEVQKGAIAIDVPSTLSRTVAFRGYLAKQMVDTTKFVKLT